MPDSFIEWVWWAFTALVLAFPVGIAINIATPRVEKYLAKWSLLSRTRWLEREKKIDEQVRKIEEDKEYFAYLLYRRQIGIHLWFHLLTYSILMFIFISMSSWTPSNTFIIFLVFLVLVITVYLDSRDPSLQMIAMRRYLRKKFKERIY